MRARVAALLAAACLIGGAAQAAQPVVDAGAPKATRELIDEVSRNWFKSEWRAYAAKFLTADGRIVDNGNSGVSHSEGQGYGLLLAGYAADPVAFERIWAWTRVHLQVRDDKLLAWRWDPKTGEVADRNNASDGDMLVAWALARGAAIFHRPDYLEQAREIAEALGARALTQSDFGPLLLPGASGFAAGDQPDGPIVNPSYWIYPAFPTLAELAPKYDWAGVARSGLGLVARSHFGPRGVPADWESVKAGDVGPARNFPPEFGYNAVRIPLYLAWSADPAASRELRRLAGLWRADLAAGPAVIDVATGAAGQRLAGAGYRLVDALARCALSSQTIDPDLIKQRDALYYPETLRMLSLAVLQERYPECL